MELRTLDTFNFRTRATKAEMQALGKRLTTDAGGRLTYKHRYDHDVAAVKALIRCDAWAIDLIIRTAEHHNEHPDTRTPLDEQSELVRALVVTYAEKMWLRLVSAQRGITTIWNGSENCDLRSERPFTLGVPDGELLCLFSAFLVSLDRPRYDLLLDLLRGI